MTPKNKKKHIKSQNIENQITNDKSNNLIIGYYEIGFLVLSMQNLDGFSENFINAYGEYLVRLFII